MWLPNGEKKVEDMTIILTEYVTDGRTQTLHDAKGRACAYRAATTHGS